MKTESARFPRYLPFGDNALLVEFSNTISLEANLKVVTLAEAIEAARIQVEELVPTYRSLLIRYDPQRTTYTEVARGIQNTEKTIKKTLKAKEGRRIIIPTVYGGEYGPDLPNVAQYHGLSEEQVVKLHSEKEYRVYMIGFVAGFPYLGEVADRIATPRLETPRLKVPAGSVGIAEKQTGIYPCVAPGGWQIIGRTPLKLFSPSWQPPALLETGDVVSFRPITAEEFRDLEGKSAKSVLSGK